MASQTVPSLSREISHNYSQLVVEHIRLVAKVYSAISYFNLNDPDKAQETLLTAIVEFERSH